MHIQQFIFKRFKIEEKQMHFAAAILHIYRTNCLLWPKHILVTVNILFITQYEADVM